MPIVSTFYITKTPGGVHEFVRAEFVLPEASARSVCTHPRLAVQVSGATGGSAFEVGWRQHRRGWGHARMAVSAADNGGCARGRCGHSAGDRAECGHWRYGPVVSDDGAVYSLWWTGGATAGVDFAATLHVQSVLLFNLLRWFSGLSAAEEAVALYRELAETRPDEISPYIAMSLSNLADILGALGRTEEARKALDEAAERAARDGHILALPNIGPFSFSYELWCEWAHELMTRHGALDGVASARNIDIACYITRIPAECTNSLVLNPSSCRLAALSSAAQRTDHGVGRHQKLRSAAARRYVCQPAGAWRHPRVCGRDNLAVCDAS